MPSCKPRTLSPGNSFVPNAAFLRAAGENSTRATGPPGGRAGADRARQVPPAGGVLAVGFAAPQRSDPERSRQRGAGAPGGAGCGTSRAPGTGTWAGRRAPRLPVSPPLLRPAPSPVSMGPEPPPVPRQPPCGSGLRRGVPASRVPSPDLRLLSEASRSAPCSAAVTAPGHQEGGVFSWRSSNADAPSCPPPPPSAYGTRDGSRAQVKPVTLSRANLGSRNPHL